MEWGVSMPKICYVEKKFGNDRLMLIEHINDVVERYQRMGYDLTLRQVYYQLVASDVIPNNERSYKNLGNLINDARLAGLIDWYAIVDRTRNIRKNAHWDNPVEIIGSALQSYYTNKWRNQPYYLEVWVEKDALIGIVEQACSEMDVTCFSCRGYVSQSEMWNAAKRIRRLSHDGDREAIVLHLGDHDPSGIDMTRDIQERLDMFEAGAVVQRIALTMEQIEQFNPPPNPAKLSDARAKGYISKYGHHSWELDALKPEYLKKLIQEEIGFYLDTDSYMSVCEEEQSDKNVLQAVEDNFIAILHWLGTEPSSPLISALDNQRLRERVKPLTFSEMSHRLLQEKQEW